MIKVGLIGCGRWGRNYIRAIGNVPGMQIKYVFDDRGEIGIELPEEIKFTQDYEEVLSNREVSALIIALPARYIYDFAIKALEAGKHVLLERPIADTSEKALELANLAKEKNIVIMAAHLYIYHPAIKKLKEIIDSGELGKILHVHSVRAGEGPIRGKEDINVLWDLGPFDLSLYLYLFGKEPSKIRAFGSASLRPNIIDNASFSMKIGDILSETSIRWLDAEKINKMTIIGDKKIAIFNDFLDKKLKIYNKRVDFSQNAMIIDEGMFSPDIPDKNILEEQCRHFLECINENKRPITDGFHAHKVIKLLEEIQGKFEENDIERKKEGMDCKTKGVKFVDLCRIHEPLKDDIIDEISKVIDESSFILGKRVDNFENNFAQHHNVKYGIGVDSGTSALELSLRVLGIGNGNEVIVPANTFIATASAVSFVGAKPVFVDCDENYLIDVDKIEQAITDKTKAIIPVHLYGQPADMGKIIEIADRHNLFIIEDACQAHSAAYRGKKVGNYSHATCFSFYPGKNLGALGDGGMILTNNEALADKLKKMRNYGQSKKYYHDFIGYNRRLDPLHASVLDIKLKNLEEDSNQRREAASKYREKLIHIPKITLPSEKLDRDHVYHLFVVRVPPADREKLQEFLNEKGIETGLHYPLPIHLQEAYKELGYKEGDFPKTEKYANEILSLPIFPGITDEEIDYVCDGVKEFFSTPPASEQ